MKRSIRLQISLAAFFGFTAVLSGALGAHALEKTLAEQRMTGAWETAVLYHLTHAVVLLTLGAWSAVNGPSRARSWATTCIAGGILLFSGSIYALALGGPRLLGPVTPVGGVLLLAGWAILLRAAWREKGSRAGGG